MAGDYNINLVNHATSTETNNFINLLFSHQIIPQINRPTRYNEYSATLIDNILTNQIALNSLAGIIISDISDHLPVFYIPMSNRASKKVKKNSYVYKQTQRFDEASVLSFTEKLQNATWQNLATDSDVNNAFDNFNSTFETLYNSSFPVQTVKVKLYYNQYKPWITKGILKSIQHKNKLYKKSLMENTPESKTNYKKYKNRLTNIVRNSEKSFHINRFEQARGNMRNTWKLINTILRDTCGIGAKPTVKEMVHNNKTILLLIDL